MALNILHANSNVLIHNGLMSIVKKGGGIDKLVQCKNNDQLVEELESGAYDLVVMDHSGQSNFSLQAVYQIRENYPEIKILIISSIRDNNEVLRVLEKGTQGYLTYECDESEIIHAIFAITKGEKFFCNKVLEIILNKHLYAENCAPTSLTNRENEIASLIASGLTNKEIANRLFLSPHTIHSHRKNIMKKLGIRSASELTLYAINVGLIQTS